MTSFLLLPPTLLGNYPVVRIVEHLYCHILYFSLTAGDADTRRPLEIAGLGSSSSQGRQYGTLDPRELDALLGELTIMNARTELYLRFIRRRVTVRASREKLIY